MSFGQTSQRFSISSCQGLRNLRNHKTHQVGGFIPVNLQHNFSSPLSGQGHPSWLHPSSEMTLFVTTSFWPMVSGSTTQMASLVIMVPGRKDFSKHGHMLSTFL